MKLNHPWLLALICWGASWLIRVWLRTVRVTERWGDYGGYDPRRADHQRAVYLFWHEYMLLPAFLFRGLGIGILVSRHRDGELIARTVEHLGFSPFRGSTTRGGGRALLEMIRAEQRDLSITPDGPKGPRRKVQPGAIYLASRAGLPIICGGIALKSAWRAKSWDRFAVPRPFTRAVLCCSNPVCVPADLSEAELEEYLQQVQQELDQATERAEQEALGHGAP